MLCLAKYDANESRVNSVDGSAVKVMLRAEVDVSLLTNMVEFLEWRELGLFDNRKK